MFAERLYAAYLLRPSLARALSWTVPTSRELLTTMERVLARLAEAASAGVRVNAFRAVIASTVGFVLVHTDPAPTSESVAWRGWDGGALPRRHPCTSSSWRLRSRPPAGGRHATVRAGGGRRAGGAFRPAANTSPHETDSRFMR
ncbi:MAG: hypothetical protein H6514_14980 [Acidimicrobiaceae bacterium]|nr:hypothetical protein [Acidimicrobiaceae bacterium]